MDNTTEEVKYDIEKLAEAKAVREQTQGDITFDNAGNIVYNNRAFNRNAKRLWRAVIEGRGSCRFYTQPSGREKPKANRAVKKRERQNRRLGRIHNENA